MKTSLMYRRLKLTHSELFSQEKEEKRHSRTKNENDSINKSFWDIDHAAYVIFRALEVTCGEWEAVRSRKQLRMSEFQSTVH